jgi:hypothetical protein
MILSNWIPRTLRFLILHNATTWAFTLPRGNVAISAPRLRSCHDVGAGCRRSRCGAVTTTTPTKIALNVSGVDAVVIDSVRNLAVAGRIPWKKLLITKDQGWQILSIMRAETHTCDLVAVFILSVFLKNIGKFM